MGWNGRVTQTSQPRRNRMGCLDSQAGWQHRTTPKGSAHKDRSVVPSGCAAQLSTLYTPPPPPPAVFLIFKYLD